MLLELRFIACKVSTSFGGFFLPQIIATTLLDSFKENSTFLALNFNFGKNTKIWTGRRAFLLENIIENWIYSFISKHSIFLHKNLFQKIDRTGRGHCSSTWRPRYKTE